METSPTNPLLNDAEIGPVLFQDVLDRFVQPEVGARHQSGRLPDGTAIFRFQVLLHPERAPEVRLNEEVGGTLQAVATRDMEAGESVTTGDFSDVKGYEPPPDDAGVPHVTAFAHSDGWSVAFDFTYRHPRRFEYLASGRDFAATARDAFAAGRLGVALDNAHSAAELFAKAELLSCHPTIEAAISARSHNAVATPYSLWSQLGNTDPRFVRLLYRFQELRSAGRYLNKNIAFKNGEPDALFDRLAEMEVHVTSVAEGEPAGNEPHGFRVFATREMTAGQLVTRNDFTLRPLREN